FAALSRPADVDEGFHLVCGKSIFGEGRHPYLDFFFFQMPLLPYVYGGVMKLFGYNWTVARLLCSLLASATGALLCAYAFERTKSKSLATFFALIYCHAPYVFIWFTCARTHALSTFLLMISICLLPPLARCASTLSYIISGFFLGLSVDTRLYFLVLVPVLAFHVSRVEKGRGARMVGFFVMGVAASLMVNAPFLIADPQRYLLNVIGYHAIKTSGGLVGYFGQKIDVLAQTFLDYPAMRPTLYLGYVVVFLVYPVIRILRRSPLAEWNPAWYAAGTLFVVSLLPTPTLGQYFSVPAPFFMLVAVDVLSAIMDYARSPLARKAITVGIALGTVFFVYVGSGRLSFYILQGNNLEGSMPTEGGKQDWNLENVREVSKAIDKLVAADTPVFSLWPGYLLESHVEIMPKTENVTLLEIEEMVPKQIYALSQTVSDAEIREDISTRKIALFVYGNSIAPHVQEYKSLLIENGYTVAQKIGGISLFLSPEHPARDEPEQ
ncbi:MAG: glycosyltransferase family 39 protein, partial [Candidatus Lindowbacteria bacterium]|nr:glycosyltransferase family 39 protein [Candidatus Lindowbacteria bacterium]